MSEKLKRFISNNKQLLIMLGAIAVVFIILALTVPSFATLRNLTNLLQMIAPIAVMACGATYVLVIGGMDISNPAVMAASAVVGVYFMTTLGCNLIVGTFVILLTSALLGLINGFAIAKLKMVPMVVTLSMMTIGTGLATFLSGVRGLPRLPDSFSEFFNKTSVIIILVIVTVVLDFILTGTKFGRKLYYIGNNARTAKVSGHGPPVPDPRHHQRSSHRRCFHKRRQRQSPGRRSRLVPCRRPDQRDESAQRVGLLYDAH